MKITFSSDLASLSRLYKTLTDGTYFNMALGLLAMCNSKAHNEVV